MSNLADRLRERIRREGPITFHDWMQAALYDQRDGYYCRTDLIRQGRIGDYRTAPETSLLFAATFAKFFARAYDQLGAPRRWTIVEAGAGSGDFARGVLQTLQSNFPEILDSTTYLIDELSSDSQSKAETKLAQFSNRVEFVRLAGMNGLWSPAIMFSNELIDAFPVHRVIGRSDELKEIGVGVDDSGEFSWTEGTLTDEVGAYCERLGLRLAEGQICEINLEAERFVATAARLLAPGLLVTVDYGASRDELLNSPHRLEGTLRAFRKHQLTNQVFSDPGSQDLTATVDWTQMIEAGTRNGFETLRFERLDQFLLREGLPEILLDLTAGMTDAAAITSLQLGAREMIRPDGLAGSFQVLIQRKA